MKFSQFVKACRDRTGLKQEDFADKVGVDRVTVSQWERGAQPPRPVHVAKMLELINVPFEACLALPTTANEESRCELEQRARDMLKSALDSKPRIAELEAIVKVLTGFAGAAKPSGKTARSKR